MTLRVPHLVHIHFILYEQPKRAIPTTSPHRKDARHKKLKPSDNASTTSLTRAEQAKD